jgi:hypothetical protein
MRDEDSEALPLGETSPPPPSDVNLQIYGHVEWHLIRRVIDQAVHQSLSSPLLPLLPHKLCQPLGAGLERE